MGRRRRSVVAAGAALLVVGLGACTSGTAPDEPTVVVSVRAEAVAPEPTAVALPRPATSGRGVPLPSPPPAVPPSGAATSPPAPTAAVPEPSPPGFASSVGPITDALAARMATSWRPGCPVPLADLRYVTVTHWDMAGDAVTGELVVHADVADGVVRVFAELFAARYPVASMRLVDDFGGSDDASMAADNTSAFNCRAITGGTGWSEHAYGRAIDVNPVENPYVVVGGHVAPPAGKAFADRHQAPGVITAGDVVVRAFGGEGWRWGGSWTNPIDYQHFSTTGR